VTHKKNDSGLGGSSKEKRENLRDKEKKLDRALANTTLGKSVFDQIGKADGGRIRKPKLGTSLRL